MHGVPRVCEVIIELYCTNNSQDKQQLSTLIINIEPFAINMAG